MPRVAACFDADFRSADAPSASAAAVGAPGANKQAHTNAKDSTVGGVDTGTTAGPALTGSRHSQAQSRCWQRAKAVLDSGASTMVKS